MQPEADVCVIGAGLSGILAVKYCLEYGLSVTCYEQRAALGGLWTGAAPNVSQIGEDGRPHVAVYQSLKMDISRTLTSFTDFPLAESLLSSIDPKERFLAGTQFLEYLDLYVRHFRVDRHVQLSTRVLEVERLKTAEEDDLRWSVTVRQKEGSEEVTRTSRHRYVIVASGFYSEPFIPEIPGMARTQVQVLHTGHVRHVEAFTGRRVLVVGGSISAGDMAQAAAVAGAAKVTWAATRDPGRSVWMLKTLPFSRHVTWDECFSLFAYRYFPSWLVYHSLSKMVAFAYRHDEKSGVDVFRDSFTVQDTEVVAHAMRKGQLEIVPVSLRGFGAERTVELSDGTSKEVDVCLLGTGYKTTYPFLGPKALGEMQVSDLVLHRNMVPVDPSVLGLAFLYTTGVYGGGFCPPEMEARWLVHQIASERLSTKEKQQSLVANANWNAPIFNHGIKRSAFLIVEDLACDLYCEPRVLWSAFFNPRPWRRRVGLAAAFGPWLPHLYRLRGPHAKPREVEAVIVGCARSVRGWKYDGLVLLLDLVHAAAAAAALYGLLRCAGRRLAPMDAC